MRGRNFLILPRTQCGGGGPCEAWWRGRLGTGCRLQSKQKSKCMRPEFGLSARLNSARPTPPPPRKCAVPLPRFHGGGKNHSRSRGTKSARILQALCILLVTTGLDPPAGRSRSPSCANQSPSAGEGPVVPAEMQLQKPAESPNQLRHRMDCRIKSGNDERKKRKRNAGRRSVSCPARKRRAGRATERRLAPPSACGRARLPAFHHGSRQRDFRPKGSAPGQASWDSAGSARSSTAAPTGGRRPCAVATGVTRPEKPVPVQRRTSRAGRSAGRLMPEAARERR